MQPFLDQFADNEYLGCDDISRIQNLYGEKKAKETKKYWAQIEYVNLIMERVPVWNLFWYPRHSDIDPWHPHKELITVKCN